MSSLDDMPFGLGGLSSYGIGSLRLKNLGVNHKLWLLALQAKIVN